MVLPSYVVVAGAEGGCCCCCRAEGTPQIHYVFFKYPFFLEEVWFRWVSGFVFRYLGNRKGWCFIYIKKWDRQRTYQLMPWWLYHYILHLNPSMQSIYFIQGCVAASNLVDRGMAGVYRSGLGCNAKAGAAPTVGRDLLTRKNVWVIDYKSVMIDVVANQCAMLLFSIAAAVTVPVCLWVAGRSILYCWRALYGIMDYVNEIHSNHNQRLPFSQPNLIQQNVRIHLSWLCPE